VKLIIYFLYPLIIKFLPSIWLTMFQFQVI